MLSIGLNLGIPVALTGVVVSLAGSAVAAAALLRLGGPWAAVAWLFAPTAVFTTVPYTESLFCAAAFWAWERARADRWWAAAVLTAVACTLRVSGLFLIGALLVMIITSRRRPPDQGRPGRLDAAPARRDRGLRRLPLPAHRQLDRLVRRPEDRLGARADLALAVLPQHHPGHRAGRVRRPPLVGRGVPRRDGLHGRRHRRGRLVRGRQHPGPPRANERPLWGEASWVGVQVLAFSSSYWFFSVNRATLLWFPLWMMVGRWVSWRPRADSTQVAHRVLVGVAFAAEIVLMLWWCWLFFTGHWAS